jgi:hypothetical protein
MRGQREYQQLMGSSPEEGLASVRLRSPQMYDAVVGAFGQTLEQGGLSRAARRSRTISYLTWTHVAGVEELLAPECRIGYLLGIRPIPATADRLIGI